MNGHARFVFDWSDGRVMSERAYKMVKEDEAMAIREVSSTKRMQKSWGKLAPARHSRNHF